MIAGYLSPEKVKALRKHLEEVAFGPSDIVELKRVVGTVFEHIAAQERLLEVRPLQVPCLCGEKMFARVVGGKRDRQRRLWIGVEVKCCTCGSEARVWSSV